MKKLHLSPGLIFILFLSACSKKNDNNNQQAPEIYHNVIQTSISISKPYYVDSFQVINNAPAVCMGFEPYVEGACGGLYNLTGGSGGFYVVGGSNNPSIETDFLIDNSLTSQTQVFVKNFLDGYMITSNDTVLAWYSNGGSSYGNQILEISNNTNGYTCYPSEYVSDFFRQEGYFLYRIKIAPSTDYYYGWCHILVASDNSSLIIYDVGTDEVANQIPVVGSY